MNYISMIYIIRYCYLIHQLINYILLNNFLFVQISVGNMAVKRSSPEPIDNGMNRGQMQKKPKVQKKKKKRDPNEPQK